MTGTPHISDSAFAAAGVPEGDWEALARKLLSAADRRRGRRELLPAQMLELAAIWNFFRRRDKIDNPESTDDQAFGRFMRKHRRRIQAIGFKFNTPNGRRDAMERLKPFRLRTRQDRSTNFRILRTPFKHYFITGRTEFEFKNAIMMNALGVKSLCGFIPRF